MLGHVKNLRLDKGFCFIKPDDKGNDVFAHCSDFYDSLQFDETLLNRYVEFDVTPGRDGRQKAINVRPA